MKTINISGTDKCKTLCCSSSKTLPLSTMLFVTEFQSSLIHLQTGLGMTCLHTVDIGSTYSAMKKNARFKITTKICRVLLWHCNQSHITVMEQIKVPEYTALFSCRFAREITCKTSIWLPFPCRMKDS